MYKQFIHFSCFLLFFASTVTQAAPLSFVAHLLGANEVDAGGMPVPSDPNATGTALVTVDGDQVTWNIEVFNFLEPIIGAHIHKENPGEETGPILIDFSAMLSGSVVDPDALGITPETFGEYYVNLHTPTYPAGAIRGQLQLQPAVPEPMSLALLSGGLLLLGRMRGCKRAASR